MLPRASDQQLGLALRKWREARKLRAYVLASQSGVSQGYISDIENGRRRLNDDTAEKIAKAFDLSLADFEAELAGMLEASRDTASTLQERGDESSPHLSQTPGLAGMIPGAQHLARWFVQRLSKQEAADLVTRFMADYQAGDETGLVKANGILHILSETPKS